MMKPDGCKGSWGASRIAARDFSPAIPPISPASRASLTQKFVNRKSKIVNDEARKPFGLRAS